MIAALDPTFWTGLWKVIIADIILAGDNAVVIALAVRSLPARQQFWGRIFGAFGAVALRVAFVWIISWLMEVPFLKVAGGLALIWIAYKLVRSSEVAVESEDHVRAGTTLWQAVWVIVVADIVMSFDNVMAISAASGGHMSLVIFGLLFSIPLVIFGSGILSNLMTRWPVLIWLGAGLLGHVAGELILTDPKVHAALGSWAMLLEHRLPILLGLAITLLGWWFSPRGQKNAAPEPLPATGDEAKERTDA